MSELINGRTAEEIKTAIVECENRACKDCPYYADCLAGETKLQITKDALALIERLESERDAALAKVPRWISVEERLPQYSARYLVCHYRGQFASSVMQVSYFDTNKKEWHGASACSILRGVTHWMEKIELPKEGE